MAKQPKVKCPICGEQFYREDTPYIKLKNRYIHESCYQAREESKSEDEKEKDKLYAYIDKVFGSSANYAYINKQITDYLKQGYTYRSIRKTLAYWYDIKHNSIEKANGGIGIVPYIYQTALTYWRGIWEAQQYNQTQDLVEIDIPVREIHIAPPQRKPMQRVKRLFTFLEQEAEEHE